MSDAIQLGTSDGAAVSMPLAMMNRHMAVCGATGSGKSRTVQLLVEQLSEAGVPCFVSDIKSDLSGMAVMQDGSKPYPVRFLSLTGSVGEKVETSLTAFGPVFLAKALKLNDTQSSVLSLVFKYCSDKGIALDTFADLRRAIQTVSHTGLSIYGGIAPGSIRVLLREIVAAETRGLDQIFSGSPFDVQSLLSLANGRGVISMLELSDSQDNPETFSSFMLWMLSELYRNLPEVGDCAKPKLVFFFDEAHFLFDGASKAFMDKIEQVARLIRSKGVGIVFITQNPTDIPRTVLSQLGHRIQHVLRAFTPEDEKAIRLTARTFPKSTSLDVQAVLTTMGTGQALISVLDATGTPTEPLVTQMGRPQSRMGTLTDTEWLRYARAPQAAPFVVVTEDIVAEEALPEPAAVAPAARIVPVHRNAVYTVEWKPVAFKAAAFFLAPFIIGDRL